MMKASIEELRERFDNDVERFTNEQTGQTSTVDATIALSMIEETVVRLHLRAQRMCDLGCGAGNFSLRIARRIPGLKLTLLDLSRAMLDRAEQRLAAEGVEIEEAIQSDIAQADLPERKFDIAVAAASLHHLRNRDDWKRVFSRIFHALRDGGSFWIWDLIRHENEAVEAVQRERYADYLTELKDRAYQERVFDMIAQCDTPETLPFLLRTLEEVGFRQVDVVHKNTVFAAICARKS